MPLSVQQKDVKSDPKVVQEVSAATDNLLESLGALAVEVDTTHTHKTQLTHFITFTNRMTGIFTSKVQPSVEIFKINPYLE